MTSTHADSRYPNHSDHPDGLVEAYVAAFDAGSIEALDGLYETGGVVVPRPGNPLVGPVRGAANRQR